ncbi:MAG TPA: VWA domain-containing protein [Longimicrobiales bacterium]|nr:VWA domain-containing protein [Longimicrobiales bacterium]
MTFLWPHMLWLLALVPALIAAYVQILKRRRKTALKYASLSIVREALGKGPGWRRHVPPALMLAALTAMILSLARPAALMLLPSQRETVILAMDVSGSMRAADVVPDRITASQEAAKNFVSDQPRSTRIGIVAFAGSAQLVQQPTTNREEIYSAIERFRLQRGTNIGAGILASLQTIFPDAEFDFGPRFYNVRQGAPLGQARPPDEFVPVEPGSYNNAVIVLLTDGQATTGPDPIEVARMAADRGVRVFTVGFGSREGETVGFGGMSMRVQLDEETLRQVAEITRGRYFHAGSAADLNQVYESLTSQFDLERQEIEITALFAGIAALLTVVSAGLSMVWFGRIA